VENHKLLTLDELVNDTQPGMLRGEPQSAICVQSFDDSLNSAIHITYHISLRSSSMHEPRDPPLKVVIIFVCIVADQSQEQLISSST